MSEQRAVPEIPEDLRVQYGELMFVKKSGWHNSNVDERKFLSSIQLIERIATLTAERDSAKRELAEIEADAKAERKKYEALREERDALAVEVKSANLHAVRLKADQGKLNDEVERLDWQPITPENLPKVGDEVLSGEDGEVTVNSVHPPLMIEQYRYQGCINTGWTHFRPINAPILAARTTPPAKEPKQ